MGRDIQTFALKNLTAFAVFALAAIAALLSITTVYYVGVFNLFFAPFKFDLAQAVAEKPLARLYLMQDQKTDESSTAEATLEEAFRAAIKKAERYKKVDVEDERALLFDAKYMQSGKYIFTIRPDKIYDLGWAYETTFFVDNIPVAQSMTHKYVLCQLGDAVIFAKLPYSSTVSSGDALTGIFVPFSGTIPRDIEQRFIGYESIDGVFAYQFDTTLSFFLEQMGALALLLICLGGSSWLMIKLILQIINRENRPLYKKIAILGGDEDTIDEQLQEATRVGKAYVTKDWVITPQLFRTKIARNVNSRNY